MNAISWLNSVSGNHAELCLRLTISLFHFLWLGSVICAVVAVCTRCLSHRSAQLRYRINIVAMLAMAIGLPVVWSLVDVPDTRPMTDAVRAEPKTESDRSWIRQEFSRNGGVAEFSANPATPNLELPKIDSTTPPDAELVASSSNETNAFLIAVPPIEAGDASSQIIAPAPPSPPSAMSGMLARWAPVAAGTYLAGVLVMLLRLAVSVHGGRRVHQTAVPITDSTMLELVSMLARRLGLSRKPLISSCAQISTPVAAGILRPMIVLPASLAMGLPPDQLQAVLLHEMAHIRRYDLLLNLLQRVVESVLFFHPAVWYVSRQVSIERENCCDDVVVSTGWKRTDYAAALLTMAESCLAAERAPASALAATGTNGSEFKRRIQRLLGVDAAPRINLSGSMIAVIAILSFAGVFVSAAPPIVSSETLELPSQTPPSPGHSTESPQQDGKPAAGKPAVDSDTELSRLIGEAIAISRRRQLSADLHTPWQLMQGMLAFGVEHQVLVDGKSVSLIRYLATNPRFNGESWFQRTATGGRAHPYSKPFLFEGHPNQFAAWLAVAGVPQDTEIGVGDGHITFGDLLRHAQHESDLSAHEPWTLMLFASSPDLQTKWKNGKDETRRLEEYVECSLAGLSGQAPPSAIYNATLFGLAKARRLHSAQLSKSTLLKIDQRLTASAEREFERQSPEGALIAEDRPLQNGVPKLRYQLTDTGSTLAWISVGANTSTVMDRRLKRAARFLAESLINNARKPLTTTSLFSAIHGLTEYRKRLASERKNPAANATKKKQTQAANTKPAKPGDAQRLARRNRVLDVQGRPIFGAKVEIAAYRRAADEILGTVLTDERGEFDYPPETPAKKFFWLKVQAAGFKSHKWIGNRIVYRHVDGVRQLDTIKLHRPATVAGTVIGANGKPLADADVAVDYFQDRGSACINCIRVKTNAKGFADFAVQRPG